MFCPVVLGHVLSLFSLCSAALMARGDCPAQCSCAPSPPACPLGVSWTTDRCGCCKLCAKQFNEDCSAAEPCDHIKGLRCHLGVGGDPEKGLCRAEAQGLPCHFNGHVYQHTEDFQPNCRHQCTCMDGVVGCMLLCPQSVPTPNWHCSHPRLVKLQDGCCEEWVCEDDNHINEEPDELTHTSNPDRQSPTNHISAVLQEELQPRHQTSTEGGAVRDAASFPLSKDLMAFTCLPQTTEWTECSTMCGMGVSSRVTNNNPECWLIQETRLCQIRHCELELSFGKEENKCKRTVRPHEAVPITFGGCSTAHRYRPRICGTCSDNRCCTPSVSRTVRLHFLCPDGEDFHRSFMWIQRCSCSTSCRRDGLVSGPYSLAPGPYLSLQNDIHTFRH
ncbi:cellular communication network factor 1, like 2 [Thalassophryne amazonica]|uniref:cellular communication network factor 1, like 2 n=1 Tax=Thalassophryne amazonica TaxID=390379 RepID=UPI001471EC9C|nr:cellular communication network factor 1, like 2 [Thalassophryne amazonica]